jgi:hypothetical protein
MTAPRLKGGRVGNSPSAPPGAPDHLPALQKAPEAGTPYTAKHGDTVVFLGDIFTWYTHWVGTTMPCVDDPEEGKCPLCRKGIVTQRKGFAAILLKVGQRGGSVIYEPRILRVPTKCIEVLGGSLRGKQFHVILTKHGNRCETSFKYSKKFEPPHAEFDVEQGMINVWFPQQYQQLEIETEVLIVDDTVLSSVSTKEKSFRDELREMSAEQLAESYARFKGTPMRTMLDWIEEEMQRRDVYEVPGPRPAPSPANPEERKHVLRTFAVPVEPAKKAGAA